MPMDNWLALFDGHTLYPTIRLNNTVWELIADDPEITSVLREWQKMPASQHFPSCAQRDMVLKTLVKATSAGMV